MEGCVWADGTKCVGWFKGVVQLIYQVGLYVDCVLQATARIRVETSSEIKSP